MPKLFADIVNNKLVRDNKSPALGGRSYLPIFHILSFPSFQVVSFFFNRLHICYTK